METSVAGLDRLVADVPSPALRSALTGAASGAEAGLGVKVVSSVAGDAESELAATAVALLEAADRAEAAIHGLDGGELNTGASDHLNGTAAFASGWLRARSVELSGEIGGYAFALQAAAVRDQAVGRVLEAEDLYDAARPAERYLEAARLRSGSLVSLAASLGAAAGGAEDDEAAGIASAARSLGVAAKIQRDVNGLVSRFVAGSPAAGGPPGGALSIGVYSLPVIRAVEAEPKIASALGGPVKGEGLIELVSRIREAGGLVRAAEDCREHTDAARAAVDGVGLGEGLAALAAGTAEAADEAAAR